MRSVLKRFTRTKHDPSREQIEAINRDLVVNAINGLLVKEMSNRHMIEISKREAIHLAARSSAERDQMHEDRDLHGWIGEYYQKLGWEVECLTAVGRGSLPASANQYWRLISSR